MCMWMKMRLCSSGCWLVFFGERRRFEERFYRERRLSFWRRKREFYSVRSCCLKRSRERALQCEKLLFEGIERESFESMRGDVRGVKKEEF